MISQCYCNWVSRSSSASATEALFLAAVLCYPHHHRVMHNEEQRVEYLNAICLYQFILVQLSSIEAMLFTGSG